MYVGYSEGGPTKMSVRIRIEDGETREYLSGVIEGLSRLDELVKYNLEEGIKKFYDYLVVEDGRKNN